MSYRKNVRTNKDQSTYQKNEKHNREGGTNYIFV